MLSAISTRAISDWGVRTEHLIAGRRAYRRKGLILRISCRATKPNARPDVVLTIRSVARAPTVDFSFLFL